MFARGPLHGYDSVFFAWINVIEVEKDGTMTMGANIRRKSELVTWLHILETFAENPSHGYASGIYAWIIVIRV